MARNVQEPVTTQYGESWRDETKTTHPAFAQIRASRVSGRINLYGSDFTHNAFVSITIKRSELLRGLNNDHHFGKEELIEVSLSESQWATFVSAMNIGDGVPCTLNHVGRESVPGLPDPKSRADQFGDEMVKKLQSTIDQAQAALDELDSLGLPKGKTEKVRESMKRFIREATCNVPFVAEQFDKHVEKTVEKGKHEIHGYMTNVIHHAWAVDEEGNVVDPTLEDPEMCAYFGVKIETSVLWTELLRLGFYGILDTPTGINVKFMTEFDPGMKEFL